MTLIECFDPIPIRNVVACLRLQPEKLIFLGDMGFMESRIRAYRELFARRAKNTQVELYHVRLDDRDDIFRTLEEITGQEDECVIDITGGAEQLLMAVGAVTMGRSERKVSVQKFELRSGMVLDCDGDGKTISGRQVELTAQELIGLHGGRVYPHSSQPSPDCRPEDIRQLWELVSGDSKSWNKTVSYLNEFESRADDGMDVYLPLDRIAGGIRDFQTKEAAVRGLLEKLDRCGVITDRSSGNALRYAYRNDMLRSCVKKAGNMLEIKTLLEARALARDGKPYFCDCQMSVTIDWDGTVFAPEERVPETRNEIDVLLVRGMTPLFISCKNGDIGEEELYKLNSVAERFGSRFARKMLIATDLERKGPMSMKAYIQRAKDMGIYLVTDAGELTDRQWQEIFQEAMKM